MQWRRVKDAARAFDEIVHSLATWKDEGKRKIYCTAFSDEYFNDFFLLSRNFRLPPGRLRAVRDLFDKLWFFFLFTSSSRRRKKLCCWATWYGGWLDSLSVGAGRKSLCEQHSVMIKFPYIIIMYIHTPLCKEVLASVSEKSFFLFWWILRSTL